MTDVNKVHGPVGPQDSPMRKDRSAPDPDKFKKMHLIEEVKHTDPDEEKKRKRREEAEEDSKAAAASSFEMQDDSGPLEQESFLETFTTSSDPSAKASTSTPQADPSATLRPYDLTAPPMTSEPTEQDAFHPVTSQSAGVETQGQQTNTSTPNAEQTQPAATVSDQDFQQQIDQGKHNITAPAPPPPKKETGSAGGIIEEIEQKKPEKAAMTPEELGQQPGDQGKKEDEMTQEELAILQENAAQPAAPPPLEGKEKKKEDLSISATDPSAMQATGLDTPMLALPDVLPPESLPRYTTLSPHVMELFDRMVGVMTVMSASDMTETVVTLNSPQFASSVFFGSQIIIQEFSSAPKQFNVKLNGSPQAVALFQGSTDDLMAAFQGGRFGFRINRIDTGILEEKPLFKRKESASGDNQDQTGAGPQ